jgi:pimeloyl-ACP methyl ester carboxylesterase
MLRAFVNLPQRQVHLRHAGTGGTPLVMLHASPGSSKQLERLATRLGLNRSIIAPDTPGNGDSTPLENQQPAIADYAHATIELLDNMGHDSFDLYGSHTGASIAVEIAALFPERVRKIILDGAGLFSDQEQHEHLLHYAPAIKPDIRGSHLNWAFMFCRDQYLFWPWYKHAAENSRGAGLPSPEVLHHWVLEVLKSIETYHLAYHASFRYQKRDRLPLVATPMLMLAAENDPLLDNTKAAVRLAPNARLQITPKSSMPDAPAIVASLIEAFLDGEDGV